MVQKEDYLNKTKFSMNPKWTGNLKELASSISAGGGGAGVDSQATLDSRKMASEQNPWAAALNYATSQEADSSANQLNKLEALIKEDEGRDFENFKWNRQNDEDNSRSATDKLFTADESQRGRDWQSEENKTNRNWGTSERLAAQDYSSSENKLSRKHDFSLNAQSHQYNKEMQDYTHELNSPLREAIINNLSPKTQGSNTIAGMENLLSSSQVRPDKGVGSYEDLINSKYGEQVKNISTELDSIDAQINSPEVMHDINAKQALISRRTELMDNYKNISQQFGRELNMEKSRQVIQRTENRARPALDVRNDKVSNMFGTNSPVYSDMPDTERQKYLDSQNEYTKKYGSRGMSKLEQANEVADSWWNQTKHYGQKSVDNLLGLFTGKKQNTTTTIDKVANDIRNNEKYKPAMKMLGISPYDVDGSPIELSSDDRQSIRDTTRQIETAGRAALGSGAALLTSDSPNAKREISEALDSINQLAIESGIPVEPGIDPIFEDANGNYAIISPNGKALRFNISNGTVKSF